MNRLEGKTVFSGIAIGKISILQKADQSVKRYHVEDIEAELRRVEEAKQTAAEELQKLYEKALQEVGESGAAIFEVHQMMLDDEDYLDSIHNIIETQQVNAEYAVASTGDNFSAMFAAMDDDYMQARAADIKDISERLVRVLAGHGESLMDADEPVIVVAEDLAPSETVQMDKSKVLAFVTRFGSSNSHTDVYKRQHEGQVRKGTMRPYIVHPLEVGRIVSLMTDDEEIISAAILHDTIEDCEEVTDEVLRKEFGDRVTELVLQESEDKSKTWMERKSATIHRLRSATREHKMIALADKLSNMRDIDRDYPECGEKLWERFRMKDKKIIGWYYKGIRDVLREEFEGFPVYEEYCHLVHKNFE